MPKLQDAMRKTPKIHLRSAQACVNVARAVPCTNRPYFVLLGSESSTVEIHISSELRGFEDVDADGESLESSVTH